MQDVATGPRPKGPLPGRDLCYQTTAWQRHLYEDARLTESVRAAEDKGAERFGAWPLVQRELFGRLYAPGGPKAEPGERGTPWAGRLHEQAEGLPEWRRLAERTRGDAFAAGIAAGSVGAALLGAMPEDTNQGRDPSGLRAGAEGLAGMAEDIGADAAARAQARLGRLLARAEKEGEAVAVGLDGGAVRNALRAACEAAQQEISDAENALRGLGWDAGPGIAGQRGVGSADKAALAARVAGSIKLRAIARRAGRLRRMAADAVRAKVRHAPDEVADVECGDAVPRLLPAELARYADPDLEVAFLRDLTERRCLQYRLDGKEPKGRGPIVMVLDESGSMEGEPEVWAKAVFLALHEVALRQNRAVALVQFSSEASRALTFRPGKPDPEALAAAVESFMGGGTDFGPALMEAVRVVEQEGGFRAADVVLVTDGIAGRPPQAWRDAKARLGIRCWAVAVGMEVSGVLAELADEAVTVRDVAEGCADERAAAKTLFAM
jgi:uncharacterized protein with von Willebrand factor type A (vWA) domain